MKRLSFTFLTALFIVFNGQAQQLPPCGFDAAQQQHLISEQKKEALLLTADDTLCIPIHIHVVRRDDGTGGLNPDSIWMELPAINQRYQYSGMQFTKAGHSFIDSTKYYDSLDTQGFIDLAANNGIADEIDIFVTPAINACGYGFFPGGIDGIFIHNLCAYGGASTMAHELGHYLKMYHTHENFFGFEQVNGSNCDTAGDKICDTPADPNIFGQVDGSCNYVGTAVDSSNTPYTPMTNNMMCYAPGFCRDTFTLQQIDKMYTALTTERTYLNYVICSPPVSVANQQQLKSNLLAYPNPASNILHVVLGKATKVALYNAMGQQVLVTTPTDKVFDLNIAHLPPGLYYVQAGNQIQKITVQ